MNFKKAKLIFFSLFLYSFHVCAKTIVISDIDDTIKQANSAGKPSEQVYHFLKKIPYFEMRDLFNEIKNKEQTSGEEIKFYYVSAAKKMTFNADKWLKKNNFPTGLSMLKGNFETKSTYDYKYAVIKKIIMDDIQSNEPVKVLMFGDNAQVDALVYRDLTKELNLYSRIYIRDVLARATYFDSTLAVEKVEGIHYYFSEIELFKDPEFDYISSGLMMRIRDSYKKRDLIPAYTLKTLTRRLEALYGDKNRAKIDANKYWNDYYLRF